MLPQGITGEECPAEISKALSTAFESLRDDVVSPEQINLLLLFSLLNSPEYSIVKDTCNLLHAVFLRLGNERLVICAREYERFLISGIRHGNLLISDLSYQIIFRVKSLDTCFSHSSLFNAMLSDYINGTAQEQAFKVLIGVLEDRDSSVVSLLAKNLETLDGEQTIRILELLLSVPSTKQISEVVIPRVSQIFTMRDSLLIENVLVLVCRYFPAEYFSINQFYSSLKTLFFTTESEGVVSSILQLISSVYDFAFVMKVFEDFRLNAVFSSKLEICPIPAYLFGFLGDLLRNPDTFPHFLSKFPVFSIFLEKTADSLNTCSGPEQLHAVMALSAIFKKPYDFKHPLLAKLADSISFPSLIDACLCSDQDDSAEYYAALCNLLGTCYGIEILNRSIPLQRFLLSANTPSSQKQILIEQLLAVEGRVPPHLAERLRSFSIKQSEKINLVANELR